jgi:hypothetical protein
VRVVEGVFGLDRIESVDTVETDDGLDRGDDKDDDEGCGFSGNCGGRCAWLLSGVSMTRWGGEGRWCCGGGCRGQVFFFEGSTTDRRPIVVGE